MSDTSLKVTYEVGVAHFSLVKGSASKSIFMAEVREGIANELCKRWNNYERLVEVCKFIQPLVRKYVLYGIDPDYWESMGDLVELALKEVTC